jgi:two-component system OmpR family response regulator
MLTAKSSSEDHIRGLSIEVDYYLNKPVRMRELEAIILSLYRRMEQNATEHDTPSVSWHLDPKQWILYSPEQTRFTLTHAEYILLQLLFSTPGETVSREVLSRALGKKFFDPRDRTIDLIISRLRKKCDTSSSPLTIQPVRGVGYQLIP